MYGNKLSHIKMTGDDYQPYYLGPLHENAL